MKINKLQPDNAIQDKKKSNMAFCSTANNGYAEDIIKQINDADSEKDAIQILLSSNFIQDGALFKYSNYTIQNAFSTYMPYAENMKKIGDIAEGIVPKQLDVIKKGYNIFIASKIPNTKSGELLPFRQVKKSIPKENLLSAYEDLRKITKAGITDNDVLNGKNWFVTADTHKIIIPTWERVRPIENNERQSIMDTYYNILFSK